MFGPMSGLQQRLDLVLSELEFTLAHPLYIAEILKVFENNPEALAVTLTYLANPKAAALEKLDHDMIALRSQGINGRDAASALEDIRRAITNTNEESYEFIRTWIHMKIRRSTQ